jgi:guanosine-3',5'-bis(diphosphate) 3'-pyrophosphohydrolase
MDAAALSTRELSLLTKALAFAAHKHRDQRRKDAAASPYINHPIALANVLTNEGGITDTETLCAALLHDTIEDTQTTHTELTAAFGPAIAGIVLEVTDDHRLLKHERKRLQIEHAAALSPKAKLVKLADKICNLRDMIDHPPATWTLERRREYFEWARQVVDRLRGTHAGLEAIFDAAHARHTHLHEHPGAPRPTHSGGKTG